MRQIACGIDEAGLGPLLGPLVLGYCALALPEEGADPWSLLAPWVSQDPKQDKQHLVVTDSKLVYARNPRGRARLERTALCFHALTRKRNTPVGCARDFLLGALSPDPGELDRHPWYACLPTKLPLYNDAPHLELRASLLARALEAVGLRVLEAGVRFIPEGELNRSLAETQNKSQTEWRYVLAILARLLGAARQDRVSVLVDRLGGRMRYGSLLTGAFPFVTVQTLGETKSRSSYLLTPKLPSSGAMQLCFQEKGERHAFATALASCLAKYARELGMHAFNQHFQNLAPALKPTAGYAQDGRRWLRAAEPMLAAQQVDRSLLVRRR